MGLQQAEVAIHLRTYVAQYLGNELRCRLVNVRVNVIQIEGLFLLEDEVLERTEVGWSPQTRQELAFDLGDQVEAGRGVVRGETAELLDDLRRIDGGGEGVR